MLASRVRMATFKDSFFIPEGYEMATEDDFMFVEEPGAPNTYGGVEGFHIYVGTKPKIVIPNKINGYTLLDYAAMFMDNNVVTGVANLPNNNVTNMNGMFSGSQATSLDLSNLDTSNVTNMNGMFSGSQATSLDLSNLDTSNVTDMNGMFSGSQATSLDLSNLDTSNVTDMGAMFNGSSATTLDLSSFDTSNVTYMGFMFRDSSATTLDLSSFDTSKVTSMSFMFYNSSATTGYARTQADADRFNASSNKPAGLTFIVKP